MRVYTKVPGVWLSSKSSMIKHVFFCSSPLSRTTIVLSLTANLLYRYANLDLQCLDHSSYRPRLYFSVYRVRLTLLEGGAPRGRFVSLTLLCGAHIGIGDSVDPLCRSSESRDESADMARAVGTWLCGSLSLEGRYMSRTCHK